MIRRPIGAAALLLISACGGGASSLTSFHDPGTGLDYLIEHSSGPALSAATDRVFVVINGERKKVFSGYGGEKVLLRSSGAQALAVEYCGGTIEATSSFLLKADKSGHSVAIRIQPIVLSDVKIGGVAFCSGD
jgi:hypothetical protein